MLVKNYTRRNKIANTLFVGGLVFVITSLIGLGGLTLSHLNMENKLKSLPRYMADSRQTYEQGLKNNKNLTYGVSVAGLLAIGATALGKKLYRED